MMSISYTYTKLLKPLKVTIWKSAHKKYSKILIKKLTQKTSCRGDKEFQKVDILESRRNT